MNNEKQMIQADSSNNSMAEVIELSEEELQQVIGGSHISFVIHDNGTITVKYTP